MPTLEGRIAALEAVAAQHEDLVEMVRDLFAIVKEQGRQVKTLAHALTAQVERVDPVRGKALAAALEDSPEGSREKRHAGAQRRGVAVAAIVEAVHHLFK